MANPWKQKGFWFKQPLVGEKHCVTTLITAAKETKCPWERGVLGIGQISREGEVETKDRVECPRREVLGFFL